MECYETSNPNGDGFNMYEEQDFANCTAAVFKTSLGDFCFSLADTRPIAYPLSTISTITITIHYPLWFIIRIRMYVL
jgi:hypothetical protein